MANRTRVRKPAQRAHTPELAGPYLMGQALRGICAGTARSIIDWVIRVFAHH